MDAGLVRHVGSACVLPLLFPAACSDAPTPHGSPDADTGASAIFSSEDAGTFDADADLGLACTDASPSFRAAVAPILAARRAAGPEAIQTIADRICAGAPND